MSPVFFYMYKNASGNFSKLCKHAHARASSTSRVCEKKKLAEGTRANSCTKSHDRSLRQRLDKYKKGGKSNQRDGPHQSTRLLCAHRLSEKLNRDRYGYPLTNGDQEVRKIQH